MWTEISTFVKANSTEALLISIIGTIVVWLYKQFKDIIERKRQDKIKTIQLKQGLFTKLELSIASMLQMNNEECNQRLYTMIGECGPYLTSMQRQVIRNYYKHNDPILLHSLQALTVSEVDKLVQVLDKMMEYEEDGEWLHYIQRLYDPVWPLLFFGFLALYCGFFFTLILKTESLWMQFSYFFCGFAILLSISIAYLTIHQLIRRQFRKLEIKRWIALVVTIVLPLLVITLNRYDVSIFMFGVQAALLAYLFYSKRPVQLIKI